MNKKLVLMFLLMCLIVFAACSPKIRITNDSESNGLELINTYSAMKYGNSGIVADIAYSINDSKYISILFLQEGESSDYVRCERGDVVISSKIILTDGTYYYEDVEQETYLPSTFISEIQLETFQANINYTWHYIDHYNHYFLNDISEETGI